MTYAFCEPFDRLTAWLKDAERSEPNDPNALYLATVDGEGRPSVRTVLLKGLDTRGLVIYTNLTSRKGRELLDQRTAAMLFHWKSLERQVRVEGSIEQVADAEADAYFASRARGSQIGAHASLQSQPIDTYETLRARVAAMEEKYEGKDVPRPAHWSGLRLIPDRFEFWHAGEYRLHEREILTPQGDGWIGELQYP